jgi:NADPH-dependent F420 reductase
MTVFNSKELPSIAILGGTGKEGPGLALRWAHYGYPVIIGSRQLEKAQRVANELNQELGVDSIIGLQNNDAARAAEICVLTVVYTAHQATIEGLKPDLQGKILVDATARIDFRNPVPPEPPSAARIAQEILGDRVQVVAAFQNVPAHVLRSNLGGKIDSHVLVCSDDRNAADEVITLAVNAGMDAYYAGNLDNAVVVEGLTAVLISINKYYRTRTASISVSGVGQK